MTNNHNNHKNKNNNNNHKNHNSHKFTGKSEKELASFYLKNFADTAREPFLILDSKFRVVGANISFYKTFNVTKEQTEGQLIFDLGNGQWNIPELKVVLQGILPEQKSFNDFEVTHNFPEIGMKTMILNAMQLDTTQQILLAIEDITVKKEIEKKLADYTNNLEKGVAEKTAELHARIDELSKLNKLMVGRELEMIKLKQKVKELEKTKTSQ